MPEPLLQVKDLKVYFYVPEGTVRAVRGVSWDLYPGETLGLVGESGCGKSVTALSLLRLIPNPPGKIVEGEIIFDGEDLLKKSMSEMRDIRGNKIAMIFQEPMTSLNPVLTIGSQITEVLDIHLNPVQILDSLYLLLNYVYLNYQKNLMSKNMNMVQFLQKNLNKLIHYFHHYM